MSFEFEIHYKEGASNVAADALSRNIGAELMHLYLHTSNSNLMAAITEIWNTDPTLKQIIDELKQSPCSNSKFSWQNDELR